MMKSFSELPLLTPLQQALETENYVTPTPIQAQAIPVMLKGLDVLGRAHTGTGKTAAFSLPVLQHLAKANKEPVAHMPRALILGPTRELVAQINESMRIYGKYVSVETTSVFGGVSMQNQIRAMRNGVHAVVATPGRLLDLIDQGCISLDALEIFVLDEADRMLDMGFLPAVRQIIRLLPKRRQSAFFSATLPGPVIQLAEQLLRNPVRIDVAPPPKTVNQIDQRVVHVERTERINALCDLLADPTCSRVMVFTRTKRGADQVAKKLIQYGIQAAAIHGGKSQSNREKALRGFRSAKFNVLVATDLAARGIDVDDVSHVVNFDIPDEPESYIHRIGRTGRAGSQGTAVAFCGAEDRQRWHMIQKAVGQKIPAMTLVRSERERVPVAKTPASDVPSPMREMQEPRRPATSRTPRRYGSGHQTRLGIPRKKKTRHMAGRSFGQ